MSTIEVTDENYRILSQYFAKTGAFNPAIPLGTRGELMGRQWEVIGYLVRMDVASSFMWDEYLLFNPYYGYRWLTDNKGHWSFVTPIKEKPRATRDQQDYGGQRYFKYYKGSVEVFYVLGEFYWLVQVGKQVWMEDYICPPKMLSVEYDNTELGWAVSEYLDPADIQKAFKLDKLHESVSISPIQPSPWKRTWTQVALLWFVFFGILSSIELWQLINSHATIVYENQYAYSSNLKSAVPVTTPVFTAEKDMANLQLVFNTGLSNSWLYVSGELVNNDTGETYYFDKTIEYYWGSDSDGPWTEGSKVAQLLMPSIPKGKYYLNLDTESGGFPVAGQPEKFDLQVWRNVPTYADFFWCLLAISILPIYTWWQMTAFESARWSDSDYSPYRSSDSD